MGLGAERASSSLRFSLGVETTREAVDGLLAALPAALERAGAAVPS